MEDPNERWEIVRSREIIAESLAKRRKQALLRSDRPMISEWHATGTVPQVKSSHNCA